MRSDSSFVPRSSFEMVKFMWQIQNVPFHIKYIKRVECVFVTCPRYLVFFLNFGIVIMNT